MIYDSTTPALQQFDATLSAMKPVTREPAGFGESFMQQLSSFWREDQSTSRLFALGNAQRERAQKIREVAGDKAFIRALTLSGDPATTQMIESLAAEHESIKTDAGLMADIKDRNTTLRKERDAALEHQTMGGKIGGFLGTAAGAITDPLNLATLPLGASWATGILKTALIEAGIAMGTEAAIQPSIYRYKKELESPYDLSDVLMNIGGAGVGAGVLTGGIKATARAISKLGRFNVAAEPGQIEGIDDLIAMASRLPNPTDEQKAAVEVLQAQADAMRQSPFTPVYHGSPHEFTRLDPAKIGTGEGAASYGHGLYFAENMETAKAYQHQTAQTTFDGRPIREVNSEFPDSAMQIAHRQQIPIEEAAKIFDKTYDQATVLAAVQDYGDNAERFLKTAAHKQLLKEYLDSGRLKREGNIYRGAIPNEQVNKMLDWDKPLSEQAASVKAAVKESFPNGWVGPENPTGSQIVEMFGGRQSNKLMLEAGIPGIKYLDQGSRTGGEGTRNFVIFNPDDVKDFTRIMGEAEEAKRVNAQLADAHLGALAKATDDIEAGRAVDVSEFIEQPGERVRIVKEGRGPRVPRESQTLGEYIRNSGGISIDRAGALRGEYEALLESGGRKSGTVKLKAGLSPDELAQRAHEAGYIEDADPYLLKEALERDLNGDKVYSFNSDRFERKIELSVQREMDDFDRIMQETFEEEAGRITQGRKVKELLDTEDIKITLDDGTTRSAREVLGELDSDAKAMAAVKTCLGN